MFNAYDYNDNIAYCEYVYSKNIELDLGLNSRHEIQYVANKYLDKINEIRGFEDDDVFENDAVLQEVVAKAHQKFANIKNRNKVASEEDELNPKAREKFSEIKAKEKEEEIDMKLAGEKKILSNVHKYSESYDDKGLDEITEEEFSHIVK